MVRSCRGPHQVVATWRRSEGPLYRLWKRRCRDCLRLTRLGGRLSRSWDSWFPRSGGRNSSHTPGVRLIPQSFEQWRVEAETFDLGVIAHPLSGPSPQKCLLKASDELRPGGAVAIIVRTAVCNDASVNRAFQELLFAPASSEQIASRGPQLDRDLACSSLFRLFPKRAYAWAFAYGDIDKNEMRHGHENLPGCPRRKWRERDRRHSVSCRKAPGDLRQPVGLAIAAAEQEGQALSRKVLRSALLLRMRNDSGLPESLTIALA